MAFLEKIINFLKSFFVKQEDSSWAKKQIAEMARLGGRLVL